MDQQLIEEAFNILVKEGRKAFVDDYDPSMGECVGMALTKISDNCFMALEIAETFLEDWNWHSEVAVINLLHNGVITQVTLDSAMRALKRSLLVKENFIDPPTKRVSIELYTTNVSPI